jgi:hypothetical protein
MRESMADPLISLNLGIVFAMSSVTSPSYMFIHGGQFFTPQQWNDGTASQLLKSNEQLCINELTNVEEGKIITGVVYPTTGLFSAYRMSYNTSNPRITTETDKITVSQQVVGERQIYLYFGCFVYHTGNSAPHHSFFCFFYQPSVSDIKGLPYCQFAQSAD